MFDPSAIVDYLATLALNNGEAYRNGRNVQQAIQQAKRELIVEFTQLLNEISNQAADEVNAEWFEDEIKAAESQALRGFWPLVDAGQTVEVSQKAYEHYFEALPLIGMLPNGYLFAEGEDYDDTGKRLVYKFYRQSSQYYCQRIPLPTA